MRVQKQGDARVIESNEDLNREWTLMNANHQLQLVPFSDHRLNIGKIGREALFPLAPVP